MYAAQDVYVHLALHTKHGCNSSILNVLSVSIDRYRCYGFLASKGRFTNGQISEKSGTENRSRTSSVSMHLLGKAVLAYFRAREI